VTDWWRRVEISPHGKVWRVMAVAPLLEGRDLKTEFRTKFATFRAVGGGSFAISPGKRGGVGGGWGWGQSGTPLRLVPLIAEPGRIAGGEVRYGGRDLLALPESEMRRIRGNKISMIFQEPMTSLNPVIAAGEQVAEAVRLHQGKTRRDAAAATVEMFR